MSTRSSATLATAAILACSCATQPRPPIDPPHHTYLPQKFEMHYLPSSIFGGRTEIIFQHGYLVRRKYVREKSGAAFKNVLETTEYFVPTEERWREFWQVVEQLRIWQWRERYDASDVGAEIYDGGGWHLLLAYHGKTIDTRGENAGPKPGNPKATSVDEASLDRQLATAISRLIEEPG